MTAKVIAPDFESVDVEDKGNSGRLGLKPEYNLQANVSIGLSPGRGRGVFALKDFEKGDKIGVCPGLTLDENDAELIQYTDLANYVFLPTSDQFKNRMVVAFGFASMINHKAEENATYYVFEDSVHVVCRLPIKKGEEIFINYGWDLKEFI